MSKVIQGTTKSGFEYSYEAEKLNDMRVIDALNECAEGNLIGMSQLAKLILSAGEKDKLYSLHKEEDGRIDPQGVVADLFEIVGATRNGKN